MDEQKRYTGTSADDAWDNFTTDITWQESPNNYRAVIHSGQYDVELETVRSPGGGDEGWGFEQTTFKAPVTASGDFKFAIVPEDFANRIGKVFGMQDVKIGYPEFDKNVLVQTNNEQKLKNIFADASVREVFQNLSGYSLHIDKQDEGKGDYLHLILQHAITDNVTMRRIFSAFHSVLKALHHG